MQIEEIKSQHQISKTKTLIDINKTATNFEAEIEIICQNPNEPLYVAILNQTQLDNLSELPYNKILKNFKDYIKVTDNVFQNYFCVVKSDNPNNIDLTIKLRELPKVNSSQPLPPQGMPPQGIVPQGMPSQGIVPQEMPPQGMSPQGMVPQGMSPQGMVPQGMPPQENNSIDTGNKFNWKIIFYVALFGIIGYLVYKFLQNKNSILQNFSQTKTETQKQSIDNSSFTSRSFKNNDDDYLPNFNFRSFKNNESNKESFSSVKNNTNQNTYKKYSFMY
jgi:hypothetical protein